MPSARLGISKGLWTRTVVSGGARDIVILLRSTKWLVHDHRDHEG